MSFRRLTRGVPAVARGSMVLFSAYDQNGPMWIGTGPREERRRITFTEAFLDPPEVTVSLNMWDIADGANQRVQISAEHIERNGFTAVFRTWGDTRVARVSISWMALGVATDPEIWDV